jgi:hypothetical protein
VNSEQFRKNKQGQSERDGKNTKIKTTNHDQHKSRTQQTNGNKYISKSKKVPIVDCFLLKRFKVARKELFGVRNAKFTRIETLLGREFRV